MTGMGNALRGGRFLASAGAFAALAALIAVVGPGDALAQNAAECARLQQAIASRHGSSGAQAAVERQRAELSRTEGSARSLGCGNRKIFCSSARIRRRNAANSTARSRACRPISLIWRRAPAAGRAISSPAITPNAGMRRRGRPTSSRRCSAASRGLRPRSSSRRRRTPEFEPLDHGPADRTTESGQPADRSGVVAHSGSYAVCVRTCDGSFFPVSYPRREPRGQPGGSLQGVVPERRHGALFVPVRRNDRRGQVVDRRGLRQFAERRKIRARLRPGLLLPARGRELGRGPRRRRGAVRPREARHHRDAGEIGRNGPADH